MNGLWIIMDFMHKIEIKKCKLLLCPLLFLFIFLMLNYLR